MKKVLTLFTILLLLCLSSMAIASPITIVEQGDEWNYSIFSDPDLWSNWSDAGHDSFNWGGVVTWNTGNAAFGNTNPYSGLYYNTYWGAGTDLAMWNVFDVSSALEGSLTLNVASDNGFMVFINGVQVAKANAEGFTSIWEYTYSIDNSLLSVGDNLIEVLAEDHGGITYFDMQLSGETAPVPEPATMMLFGIGLLGLAGISRKKHV